MKKIKINDITIRDIFQTIDPGFINQKLLGRIIDHISKVKFDSIEVFGGSAFEKMLSNYNFTNPFEIVETIKNKNPMLNLVALIGARNLVSIEVYPATVIKKFIKNCIKAGINRFKVFDALNDFDNFRLITEAISENGSTCQGTIIFDDLQPPDYYIDASAKLKSLGCESICIKDVESTLLPHRSQLLFRGLNSALDIKFYLSTYNLRGLQVSNYYNACMEGCEGVDLSFIPSSYNDLSPSVFPLILSLKDTGSTVETDYLKVLELFEWFKKNIYPMIKNEMLLAGFIFSNKNRNLLPKWLLTSINSQLSEIGESNRIDIVLEEVFRIKNEIGNPSLSTPVGQIIGSQAILNTIISDYRWEITNDEIKKLVNGYYGRLPRNIDEKVASKIIDKTASADDGVDQEEAMAAFEPKKYPPEDDKTFTQCAEEIKSLSSREEDVLSYMFFPDKTYAKLEAKKHPGKQDLKNGIQLSETGELRFPDFFQQEQQASIGDIDLNKIRQITELVDTSNIDEIKLEIDGVKISINKKAQSFGKDVKNSNLHDIPDAAKIDLSGGTGTTSSQSTADEKNIVFIKSPIVGTFYRSSAPGAPPFVEIGTKVKKGQAVCIIEAMKLMNKINSDYDGTVLEILAVNEDAVEYDQALLKIKI